MATLNQARRGKRGLTNVLAFSYGSDIKALHGDIVLCVPVAKREAKALKQSLSDRLATLLIHGIVHVAGYTHDTDENAKEMERIEKRITRRLRPTND